MKNASFLKLIADDFRKAWLCSIGYHDNPLSLAETRALNDIIVLDTNIPLLMQNLASLFDKRPEDKRAIAAHIDTIESLGLTCNEKGEVGLIYGSPMFHAICAKVRAHAKLKRLAAFLEEESPALSVSTEATAN